jgi:hypothetical protein
MISGELLLRTCGSLPYMSGSLPHIGVRLATPGRGGSVIREPLSRIGAALSGMRHGLPAPYGHLSAASNAVVAPVDSPLFRDGELVRILERMARTGKQLNQLMDDVYEMTHKLSRLPPYRLTAFPVSLHRA